MSLPLAKEKAMEHESNKYYNIGDRKFNSPHIRYDTTLEVPNKK